MSVRLVRRSVWGNPGNRHQLLQRTCGAIWWQLYKRWYGQPRTILLPSHAKFRAWPDCVVSSALIYAAWPEYYELQFIRSILKPTTAVVDVGANVGHISLLLSDLVGPERLFAFEPTPVTYRRLVENWALNGWDSDRLYPVAIGDEEGYAAIPDVSHPDTMNSLNKGKIAKRIVQVPMRSLDSFRANWFNTGIGLLKVDVEGFEPEVFKGAIATLREIRPRLVMFESLGGTVNPSIAKTLQETCYSVFQLDCHGRPDFSKQDAQNLFAVPNELRSALRENT